MTNARAITPGGAFILDAPEHVPAVWGDQDAVAWSQGESCFLVGPPGVGKSTIAQQVVLARADIAKDLNVLGMVVTPDERPTLYLAADRPRQIARSFRRMVKPRDRAQLDSNLLIWSGPPPFDIVRQPELLAEWLVELDVGTVVIDSLKDIALRLSDDETGGAVNRALALVVAAGIEVLVLHHQRKAQTDNRKPRSLSDVYGSGWLTAGAGSVLLAWGDPGDLIIELSHLKQPATEISPLALIHDHHAGTTSLHGNTSLPEMLRQALSGGLEVHAAAMQLYGTSDPNPNQVEKTRRGLKKLVATGVAVAVQGERPKDPVRYRPTETRVMPRDASRDQSRPASRPITKPANTASHTHHAPSRAAQEDVLPLKGDGPTEREATQKDHSLEDRAGATDSAEASTSATAAAG